MRPTSPTAALVLGLGLALAACGGGSSSPDARVSADGAPHPDAPVITGCDYTEAADATNATTAEDTGLTVGPASFTICGKVDPGHFANGDVDVDGFHVTVGGSGADVLVRLTSPGAGDLGQLFVQIEDDSGGYYGYGVYTVDHGVMNTHLPAGTYVVVVVAQADGDISSPVDYKVSVSQDTPATRCPMVTAAANHVETDESASQHTADDVIYITSSAETLTPSDADAPDDSQIVVTSGMAYRITGDSANVNVDPPNGDDYMDRDTYLISTGNDTNELQIRLTWADANADLDFYLFPEVSGSDTPVDIGSAATTNPVELQTIAVKPSSRYWLWAGSYDGSTGLPTSYDLSICGQHVGN